MIEQPVPAFQVEVLSLSAQALNAAPKRAGESGNVLPPIAHEPLGCCILVGVAPVRERSRSKKTRVRALETGCPSLTCSGPR